MSDETMSVLPRIFDPSMNFTVNSLKEMPSKEEFNNLKINESKKNTNNFTSSAKVNTDLNLDEEKETKETSTIYSFFDNYKYIILTVFIIILLIILGVLIYKYYIVKNKKKKENQIDINTSSKNINPDIKQKVDNYISNYIIEEDQLDTKISESDTDSDTESEVEIDNKIEPLNNIELLNNNNKSLPNLGINLIIQETIAIDPKLHINSTYSRFEEVKNESEHVVEPEVETEVETDVETEVTPEVEMESETNKYDNLETHSLSDILEENNIDSMDTESIETESIDINDIIHELNHQDSSQKSEKHTKNNNKKKNNIDHFKAYIKK
jgi:hypothetical protein